MSAEVVSLDSRRPHMSGTFMCLVCEHEWVAVAPLGTEWVECPACRLHQGHVKFPVTPETAWHCNCGNGLFYLSVTGNAVCPCCGAIPTDWP